MTEHIPRHRLEEPKLAELDRRHLEICPACAGRRAGIEEARAAFLAAHSPAAFARRVLARAAAPATVWQRLQARFSRRGAAFSLAAAAALVLVVVWRAPGGGGDAIRLKGTSSLRVFVERPGGSAELHDGDPVAAGDRLAFACHLSAPRFVVLWGMDPSGTMTRYY